MKRILLAVPFLLLLAACGKDTKPAPAASAPAAVVVAPAPPKPEGGPQAPELSPEALKALQK